MAKALPAKRRLVVLGQAGDRSDSAIRDLARIAFESHPDLVILKETRDLLRGREEGEVTAILKNEFLRPGTDADSIRQTDSDYDAVLTALAWSRPGDLILLLTHADRPRILGLLESLAQKAWHPGTPLPTP
jgi:UDP-N-acetylmuramyl tripeptide synthase